MVRLMAGSRRDIGAFIDEERSVESNMTNKSAGSLARIGDGALRRSPLQMVARAAAGGVPILAYHDIADPIAFESHLRYMKGHYRPVRLADIIAAFNGEPIPPRSILVTLDDGDPSVFDAGLPLLRKHGFPSVAFVISGLVGTTRMLWTREVPWLVERGGRLRGVSPPDAHSILSLMKKMDDEARIDALAELRESAAALPPPAAQMDWADLKAIDEEGLMNVEDHSFSHPQLDRCSPESVRDDIVRSRQLFQCELGRRPRAFAYPDGASSAETVSILASEGYEAAFLFNHRRAQVPGGNRWGISRVRVNSTTSLDRFAIILSGLHPAIHRLRGRR